MLSQLSESLCLYQEGAVDSAFEIVLEKKQTGQDIFYRVQLSMPELNQPFEIFVLEGEKAFNPTYIELRNDSGQIISITTREFIEIEGIFLPSKEHLIQFGNDGCLQREARTILSDMQVNKPLPEETFSLNNLGLQDGDEFKDEIQGKKYTVKAGQLVEDTK